jgi:hypothetical protein
MNEDTKAALLAIAREHMGFKTFNVANSDREDFRDVAVWNVEKALLAAFELGKASK